MNRFIKFAAAGTLFLLTTGPVWAQAKGGGTTGTQATPVPTTRPQAATAATSASGMGTINATPFFSNPAVRNQLGLSNQAFNTLNNAHSQALAQFNTAVSKFGSNLTAQQRAQQLQDLQNAYSQRITQAAQNAITNPTGQQRFNELSLQFQGFGAFNNPQVQQQLNLTNQQSQRLQQLAQQFNLATANLRQNAQANPMARNQQFLTLRQNALRGMNSVLTPQQQQAFQQMTGQPFSFQFSDFFPPAAGQPLGTQQRP